MARGQHMFHFALQIFWKHFLPSAFKGLYESYMKMHVGCQVKHTLFLFGLYNMSKTKDPPFHSKDA